MVGSVSFSHQAFMSIDILFFCFFKKWFIFHFVGLCFKEKNIFKESNRFDSSFLLVNRVGETFDSDVTVNHLLD